MRSLQQLINVRQNKVWLHITKVPCVYVQGFIQTTTCLEEMNYSIYYGNHHMLAGNELLLIFCL